MSEWREIALGDLIAISHGFAFKGEYFGSQGPNVLLTPKNFRAEGGLDLGPDRCKYYDGPVDENFVLQPHDVVVAMTDLKQDAPILGSAGKIPVTGRYLHNQRIGKVQVIDPSRLVPDFLPWLLNSPTVRARVRATATGATVRHTAPTRILEAAPRIPPLEIQKRISAILGTLDELIEINERRIELLEALARSLYREWFVRFRFPGARPRPASAGLPEGWKRRPAEETATFMNGYAFKPTDWGTTGAPIIKIKELRRGVSSSTPRYAGSDVSERFIVERGDLLFSWSAHLGVYLWAGETGLLNQHLFKVTPAAGLTVEYLFHALAAAVPDFDARAQGTTMRHIKRSALREVPLDVPTADVITAFSDRVSPLHDEWLTLAQVNRVLATVRDLLLPRLVTGRIDISEIDLGDLLAGESQG